MHAIGVPERERHDDGRRCSAVREPVAHALPHADALHECGARLDRHRRRKVDHVVRGRRRVQPVDRDATTHHIEVALRIEDRRGAVRSVGDARIDAFSAHRVYRVDEPLHLACKVPVTRHIGRGEMREGTFLHQTRHALQACCEARSLLGAHADAVHAGIDLEMVASRHGALGGGSAEAQRELTGRHRGDDVVVEEQIRRGGRRLREHVERRVDAGTTNLQRLVDRRHAEPIGTGGEGGSGHVQRAVSVAVRLHDSHEERPWRREGLESAHVLFDSAKVDLGPCPTRRRHRVTPPRAIGPRRTYSRCPRAAPGRARGCCPPVGRRAA